MEMPLRLHDSIQRCRDRGLPILAPIPQPWKGKAVAVIASGPSLSRAQCQKIEEAGIPAITVNNAVWMAPYSQILYANDAKWWKKHGPMLGFFNGLRFSSHQVLEHQGVANNKEGQWEEWGLTLVAAVDALRFSFDQMVIHYGQNSGFQAINLALALGAKSVVLVGFDFQYTGGKAHYFGSHEGLNNPDPDMWGWKTMMYKAAQALPKDRVIVNASGQTALECFPRRSIDDYLSDPFAEYPDWRVPVLTRAD